ncbi:MAG: glycosyltransferase [Crocinitomicaceae bacterium]|nr:glycosyltransferase [Crocinitomicaceae bacterium]
MKFLPEITFDFTGIVFLFFCLMVFVQIMYLFIFRLRLLLHRKESVMSISEGVSIIICARNEENNLVKNLEKILKQDYPKFEVIVVLDQTADDSVHIIRDFQKTYPHLRYIELERNQHRKFGKKIPLTVGIKGATYEKLLFIDADCHPATDQWIRYMLSNYSEGKRIVVGYGPYTRIKGLLNKLIRFDTAMIALNYLGFAKNRRPYMGVGRNMSYEKDLWFEVDGFKSHYHIQSGDDDLFMQDAANRKNVAIEIHPDSWVYSHPKTSWKEWVNQKQRHFTTASKYRLINKVFLGIFPLSMILMLASFFILLFSFEWWLFVLTLLLFRCIMYWIIDGFTLKKLGQKDLIILYPILELVHFIIIPFMYYSSDREADKW